MTGGSWRVETGRLMRLGDRGQAAGYRTSRSALQEGALTAERLTLDMQLVVLLI